MKKLDIAIIVLDVLCVILQSINAYLKYESGKSPTLNIILAIMWLLCAILSTLTYKNKYGFK